MTSSHLRWGALALLTWATASYFGCAASSDADSDDDGSSNSSQNGNGGSGTSQGGGGSSQGGSTSEGGGGSSQGGGLTTVGQGGSGGFEGCAEFSVQAQQDDAAMLIALDMSASMSGNKYSSSQLAIVQAIDKDVMDSMHLGLVTFPTSFSDPPECLCQQVFGYYPCASDWNLIFGQGVSCGVSGLPQVAMSFAGPEKSNAGSGVRKSIYDYLVTHTPQSTTDDGSPIYEGMLAGYNALAAYPNVDKRMLLLITDGGFSCTSVANPPRPAYQDANNCPDWEHPDSVNDLIIEKRDDPTTPINTFIVGVPGSDTTGSNPNSEAPYSMQLALSTYAANGSPDTIDPACDSNLSFSQGGPPPANPCHIDLTQGQFNANTLADAISALRGEALGCIYPVPDPPMGETIDPNLVNVVVTVDGNTVTLPRRSDPNDECLVDGCWDYDAEGNIVIIGISCDDISGATEAEVDIEVGCETILK